MRTIKKKRNNELNTLDTNLDIMGLQDTESGDMDLDNLTFDSCEGEYEEVLLKLKEYACGEPSRAETDLLFKRVKLYMDEDTTILKLKGLKGIFSFAKNQLSVLKPYLVLMSLIIVFAGVFLIFVNHETENLKYLLFVSPISVSGYFIYSYTHTDRGLAEMEMSCLFTPFEIFYVRVLLVIVYDLLAGIAVLPIISLTIWKAGYLSLLLCWIVPFLASAAITLVSIVFLGYLRGGIFSTLVWILIFALDDKFGAWSLFLIPVNEVFPLNRLLLGAISILTLALLFKYKSKLKYLRLFG